MHRSLDASEHVSHLQTATSSSLLEGLRDHRNEARWQQYVDRYRPLIVSFARRRGLAAEDAEDFSQTVLMEFSRAYREGRYDAEQGRLRSWLFGIVHRQLAGFWRKKHRALPAAEMDTRVLADLGSEDDLEKTWHEEWEAAVLGQCLEEIRVRVEPRTFEAFEEFALKERPAADVARDLAITENAVFGAKRRVLERLRGMLPLMQDIW